MFFPFAFAGRSSSRGFASRLALALALASSVVVSSAVIAPDAANAQRRQRAAEGGNSAEFAAAYEPVAALTTSEMPNWSAAASQFETLVAAIKNEDDRNIAGNFALQIGSNLQDITWQRRGLQMMLQSGKVTPDRLATFQYFVGTLSYQLEDYATSRAALEAAIAAGHTTDDPRGLIMESFYEEANVDAGIAYLEATVASGVAPIENWYLSALQASYDNDMVPQVVQSASMLVRAFPTTENWTKSLAVINNVVDMVPQEQLDLLRLMRATGAMSQRGEFTRYIDNADPRGLANEVLPVLAEGLAAGHFAATGDNYYTEIKALAETRAPIDRRDLAATVRDGQRGGAADALDAGNVLYSMNEFAQAETMFQLALTKGGGDTNTINQRLGMTQVMLGKYAEAIATFGLVGGVRQPVAAMWIIFAEGKMAA